MDITMPRLDGRSVVKQIRKMELKTQPFICATSSLITEGSLSDFETERNLCFEVNVVGNYYLLLFLTLLFS